jgi:hypothetical protein
VPASDSLDRTGILVVFAVFAALVVDGMDLQMLAPALPTSPGNCGCRASMQGR